MSRNKNKVIVSIVLVIILLIATISYASDEGIITGKNVRLREKPSTSSNAITLMSKDDKVEVLEKNGEWYKVKYDNETGYVYQDYVKVTKKNQSSNNVVNNATTNSVTNTPVVNNTTSNVNNTVNNVVNNVVNSGINGNPNMEITVPMEAVVDKDVTVSMIPLINSNIIEKIKENSKVTIIEYKNGWAYIVSENNINGWIRIEKLIFSQENSAQNNEEKNIGTEQENKPIEEQTTSGNTEELKETPKEEPKESITSEKNTTIGYATTSVNVRKGSNSSSEIIDAIEKNDKVTILGEENGWYKVLVNDLEGYISKSYISNEKTVD